jgi:hypothetical protein
MLAMHRQLAVTYLHIFSLRSLLLFLPQVASSTRPSLRQCFLFLAAIMHDHKKDGNADESFSEASASETQPTSVAPEAVPDAPGLESMDCIWSFSAEFFPFSFPTAYGVKAAGLRSGAGER